MHYGLEFQTGVCLCLKHYLAFDEGSGICHQTCTGALPLSSVSSTKFGFLTQNTLT